MSGAAPEGSPGFYTSLSCVRFLSFLAPSKHLLCHDSAHVAHKRLRRCIDAGHVVVGDRSRAFVAHRRPSRAPYTPRARCIDGSSLLRSSLRFAH